MRATLFWSAVLVGLTAGSTFSQAGELYLSRLSGANEVPPTASPATGLGVVILNDAATQATVSATHNEATVNPSPVVAGHIHRGAAGTNGPVIFPFAAPSSPVGPLIWAIPPADVVNLRNAGLYMNFHTVAVPGGDIRGQLLRALLAPSATNATQLAIANALDISAGYASDLNVALIQANIGTPAYKTQVLNDLSGRSIYVQTRESIEAMAGFSNTLLARAEDHRLLAGSPRSGFVLFAAGGADFESRDTEEAESGASVTRPYFIGGVEYNFNDCFRAGLAGAYADGDNSLHDGLGETDGETWAIEGFASGDLDLGGSVLFVDAVIGYGWNSFDISRNIPSFARTATASPDGTTWAAALKASMNFTVGDNVSLLPYVMFDYQEADVDAYSESGAGALGLVVPEQEVSNAGAEIGITVATSIVQSWGTLVPRAQVGWRFMLDDGETNFTTRLVGSPVGFDTRLLGVEDGARLGASLSARLSNGLEATLGYRGLIGTGSFSAHAVEARLSFPL